MFPDLTKYVPMLQNGLDQMKHILNHIYCEVKRGADASQQQARALQFEMGVIDIEDSPRITPRRLSSLPVIVEATTAARQEIDVEAANQGRAVSRGFYANLGDVPFKVVLVGVGGQVSTAHTVPPGTTISLTCLVSQIIVEPGADGPAFYQIYVQ